MPCYSLPVHEACVAVLSSALFGNGWASGLSRRLTMILEQTLRSPCNACVCIHEYLIYIIYINTYTYVYIYVYNTQHTPIHCTTFFFVHMCCSLRVKWFSVSTPDVAGNVRWGRSRKWGRQEFWRCNDNDLLLFLMYLYMVSDLVLNLYMVNDLILNLGGAGGGDHTYTNIYIHNIYMYMYMYMYNSIYIYV